MDMTKFPPKKPALRAVKKSKLSNGNDQLNWCRMICRGPTVGSNSSQRQARTSVEHAK